MGLWGLGDLKHTSCQLAKGSRPGFSLGKWNGPCRGGEAGAAIPEDTRWRAASSTHNLRCALCRNAPNHYFTRFDISLPSSYARLPWFIATWATRQGRALRTAVGTVPASPNDGWMPSLWQGHMAQRKRPTLPLLQSNPLAKRCWDRHSAKWNDTYPSACPICVEGMSHEDADAEQDTCCRDDLAHSLPPCLDANRALVRFRMTSPN